MNTIQDLRDKVDAFLISRNMKASKFGRKYFNDPNFVQGLHKTRDLKASTIDKILSIVSEE